MKKLLGIIVLGLLWCNVGFAETYMFKKCHWSDNKKFNTENFKMWTFAIDTEKKFMVEKQILTADYLQKINERNKEMGFVNSNISPVVTLVSRIELIEGDIITGYHKHPALVTEYTVNLKTSSYITKTLDEFGNESKIQCEPASSEGTIGSSKQVKKSG